MRSAEEFEAAKRLIAAGVNDCAIAPNWAFRATQFATGAAVLSAVLGSTQARPAGSFMTSQACHPLHMPTCSACISATGAFLGTAESGD